MTKINEKTIEECLKIITKEELNKLYESIPIELKPSKKKLTIKDKIETIEAQIISGFMVHSFTFNDKELEELDNLIKGKKVENISQKLLDNNFAFKIDNIYIVPQEIIEMHNYSIENNLVEKRKKLAIQFYLLANGVLEITKLIELLKETGLKLTKKELIKLAKEDNYIVDKSLIYLDHFAQDLDNELNMHEMKQEIDYRVFTLEEILSVQMQLETENYEEKINKIISKKVKNKKQSLKIAEFIRHMATVGYIYQENIESLLKTENISLNEKEKESLLELADEIYWYYPVWQLNGYCEAELSNDDELDSSFEDLSPLEQIDAYINIYLTINGIIEIDKLLEILTINHKLSITKQELIKIATNIEELTIYNNYFCIEGAEELIDEMMPVKRMLNQYKIIEDIDKEFDAIWSITDKIIDLGFKYELDEDLTAGLEQVMRMGGVDEVILKDILEEEGYTLSTKKQKELLKELSIIQKDVRIWSLNGFKKSELTNINKKEKIGRNDKCLCGSGKKYKMCCGK